MVIVLGNKWEHKQSCIGLIEIIGISLANRFFIASTGMVITTMEDVDVILGILVNIDKKNGSKLVCLSSFYCQRICLCH